MMKESLESGTVSRDSLGTQSQEIENPSTVLSKDKVTHKSLADTSTIHNRSPSQRHEDLSKSDLTVAAVDEDETTTCHFALSSIRSSLSSTVCASTLRRTMQNPIIQKVLSLVATLLFMIMLKNLMKPSLLHSFFIWMEEHPMKGLAAYMIIYPLHMVFILPGTPLCMGAGFVFKLRYGWVVGVTFCSIITLLGSLVGSVVCFLLGRYCFRSSVRRWSKKYPLFEPIDHAVADNGFKVMVLVYLTPAVPLGPMSYMMGTTSMALIDFAKSKIAALPMTVLYVYLGAATGTLMTQDAIGTDVDGNSNGESNGTVHKANFQEMSLSPKLIAAGILLSIGIIAIISVKMKQELQKVRVIVLKVTMYPALKVRVLSNLRSHTHLSFLLTRHAS